MSLTAASHLVMTLTAASHFVMSVTTASDFFVVVSLSNTLIEGGADFCLFCNIKCGTTQRETVEVRTQT